MNIGRTRLDNEGVRWVADGGPAQVLEGQAQVLDGPT